MNVAEILCQKGVLSRDELAVLSRTSGSAGGQPLWDSLRAKGVLDDVAALQALGEMFGLEVVDLEGTPIDEELLDQIPVRVFARVDVFPISLNDGVLCVAISDPLNVDALDELQAATRVRITHVLARSSDIERLLKKHLGVGRDTIDQLVNERQAVVANPADPIAHPGEETVEEASVVRLVNEFLGDAIRQRASDVHIESEREGIRIRFRIDGVLHRQPVPHEIEQFRGAIISRIKIMANLNIAEKRLAQDGRMKFRLGGKETDVRISVIPMLHGEGVVLRLLDKDAMQFDPRNLGMGDATYQRFQKTIQRPHGIVLVTGPTGSGKTTTLYSALMAIRDEATKFVTIEDPVEYDLDGINQIQVHEQIGRTFASGLRNILRHDPDVILVGEIRDVETAEVAIQSALTGHLVFSTLHTNDAASAFVRLVDMGIEPYLVSSTIEAVMAQRLVRVICEHCKEPYHPDPDGLPEELSQYQRLTLFRGVGCRDCNGLGYVGRNGIFELLPTSQAIRNEVLGRGSSIALRQQAIDEGMTTLREDGWRMVLEGKTTVAEVMRVTKGE